MYHEQNKKNLIFSQLVKKMQNTLLFAILLLVITSLYSIPSFAGTAPVFNEVDSIVLEEDSAENQFDISSYAHDPDGGSLTFSIATEDTSKVDCTATGLHGATIKYVPAPNFNGAASCSISAIDNESLSAQITVDFTVTAVNDAPTLNIPEQEVPYEDQKSINLESFSNDADNDDELTYAIVEHDVDEVSCAITGSTLTMTSADGFFGDCTCTVRVSDGVAYSDEIVEIIVEFSSSIEAPDIVTLNNAVRNESTQTTFKIKNTGNIELSNLEFASDANSIYNVSISIDGNDILEVDEENTVTVHAFIPASTNSGVVTLGNIRILSDYANQTIVLKADVRAKLSIDSIEVTVDNEAESNFEDGDTVEEKGEPGSKIKFLIKLKNNFDSETDMDIQDIVMTITIPEIDNGQDLEYESPEFDIESDKTQWQEANVELPLLLDGKTYEITIEAEGEDENGNNHVAEFILKLVVEKKAHDLKLMYANLNDETLSCGGQTTLEVKVVNAGSEDEENVVLKIENSVLGLDLRESFEMTADIEDEDTVYYTKIFLLSVPENAKNGNYPINIKVFYNNAVLDDILTSHLKIINCAESEKVNDTIKKPVNQSNTSGAGSSTNTGQANMNLSENVAPAVNNSISNNTSQSIIESLIDNKMKLNVGTIILVIVVVGIALAIGIGIGLKIIKAGQKP